MASNERVGPPAPAKATVVMRISLRAGGGPSPREPELDRFGATLLGRSETGLLIGLASPDEAARLAAEWHAAMPAGAVVLHAPDSESPERMREALARAEAHARPGEAVATEAFWRLAQERFAFEALPEGLFRLGRPKEPLKDAFVGRETELIHLRSCWQTASRGRPLVVTLQGEPGVGKSRLLQEFLSSDGPGDRPCLIRARRDDRQHPYALLSSWLRAIGLSPAHLGPGGGDVAYLLGEEGAGSPIQPRHRQFRAFKTLNRALLERFSGAPILFALEDLHWADEASLIWLDTLLAELAFTEPSPPWLFVITERGQELHRRFAGVGLGSVAIALSPLSCQEAQELLEAVTPGLEATVRAAVQDRAGGNPLYLREFAQLARQESHSTRMPATVCWELRQRLEDRSPMERRVLEMAAILGPTFDQDVLSRLVDVVPFKQLLANLSGAGLLTRGSDVGAFAHQLLHEAAYEAIPVERRQELHAMVAHFLEAEGAAAGEVARHLLRSGKPAQARPHLLRAARSARQRLGLQEARQLLMTACQAGTEPDALVHAIRLELAEILLALGELDAARAELGAARTLVPDDQRLRLALTASQVHERRGEYSTAIAVLHEGQAAVDPRDGEERARLYSAEASLRLRRGEFAACRELAAQALEALGAEPTLDRALALSLQGIATYRLEGPDLALPIYRQALAMREQLGDPAAIAGSLSNLGIAYFELGRWDEAHACFERALESFRSIGERWQTTVVLNNMGHLLLNRGNQPEAEACYREALRLKREMGEEPGIAIALCNLGNALSRREAHAEARACLQEAVLTLERVGEAETRAEIYQVYGLIELAAGETERARRLLERALDESAAVGREVPRAIALRGLSQLAAMDERWEEALEYAWESVLLNDRLQNPLELGRSLVAWGMAHRGLGDAERSMDAIDKASVLFGQLGALPDMRALVARLG